MCTGLFVCHVVCNCKYSPVIFLRKSQHKEKMQMNCYREVLLFMTKLSHKRFPKISCILFFSSFFSKLMMTVLLASIQQYTTPIEKNCNRNIIVRTSKKSTFVHVCKGKRSYFKRTVAASWHSPTRRLYPEFSVKACFKPENANNILYASCHSVSWFFPNFGGCTSLCSLVDIWKLHVWDITSLTIVIGAESDICGYKLNRLDK